VLQSPYVVSCSRRTDVPAGYCDWLAATLRAGTALVPSPFGGPVRQIALAPRDVHTWVFISKDYRRLLANEHGVRDLLAAYEQLTFQLTITGLGGGPIEPHVPPWPEAAAQLPALVAWAGDVRRVSVRLDPIVHWRAAAGDGLVQSNLDLAGPILDAVAASGAHSVRISIAQMYPKLRRRGVQWYDPTPVERNEIAGRLQALAGARGLELYACADPTLAAAGVRPSACIDGTLLAALHPRRLPLPTHKDAGQRAACGCTPSVDIGAYQMTCPHACRYCYAQPGKA
jgi:hypothetical protein